MVRKAIMNAMEVVDDRNPGNVNSKKRRKLDTIKISACTDTSPTTASTSSGKPLVGASMDLNASVDDKWRPPIYLFYEQVDQDEMGGKEPGTKYYKCFHGNRKIFKVTKEMKGSQTGLKNHLFSHFPVMSKLYHTLNSRADKTITVLEARIAANKIPIDSEAASAYINSLGTQQSDSIVDDAFGKQAALNEPKFDPKEAEHRLVRWLVASNQPFDEVARLEFQEFVESFKRPFCLPSTETIKRHVMDMGNVAKKELKTFIEELDSNVSLSLDMWTSSKNYALMGIVMHFVSNDWKLGECLIDFLEIIGDHSGENMASFVYETITSLGLEEKIMSIVMDNSSNNDALIKFLQIYLTRDGVSFNPIYVRGRCLPHIVHLAALELLAGIGAMSKNDVRVAEVDYQESVTRSLSECDDDAVGLTEEKVYNDGGDDLPLNPIEKLRRIVKAVRASPQRRQGWLEEVNSLHHEDERSVTERGKMLILDVRTRWTSTHQMCRRALHYRKEIDSYTTKNKELRQYKMGPVEWSAIGVITHWLLTFRQATSSMSATHHPMLSSTHSTLKGLQDKLRAELWKLPLTAPPELVSALVAAHTKLGQYSFKVDASPYPVWASLLDPRINATGFLADYENENVILEEIEAQKQELVNFYNKHYADKVQTPSARQPTSIQYEKNPCDFNFNNRYVRRPMAMRNEIEEYLKLPSEDWVSTDPIQWWAARKAQFPNLSRLARDILSIPGSAVAVERFFSGGRDTISLHRASLGPDTINALMVLKHKIMMDRK